MTDKELLYIKTIAEEKNITWAAEKLHVAQPSLTQCVQRIEKSLGYSLFHRTKTGLVLTGAGELYYRTACQTLDLWKEFEREISCLDGIQKGKLAAGASWYGTLLILTGVLPHYCSCFPNADVHLTEKNTAELERMLSAGELDVILTHDYPEEYPAKHGLDSKRFRRRRLLKEYFCIAAHKKFGLDRYTRPFESEDLPVLDLKDINKLPVIKFSENQRIRHITDFAFQRAGVQPAALLHTYGFPSALELAAGGHGIAVLPECYVRSQAAEREELQIFLIDKKYCAYWTTSVCYYQSEYMPVLVRAFVDMTAEHIREV